MASATDAVKTKGGPTLALLRGQDLYAARPKLEEVKVTFAEVRDPGKQFNSPLIADLDGEVLDCAAFPLNKTNVRKLVDALGDDYSKWGGTKCVLSRYLTNNPQTKGQAWGLAITKINGKAVE